MSKETERQPASVNEAERKAGFAAPSGSVVEMHVNYGNPRTHGYDESWEKLELHCPNCGEKQVWHETFGGDYYVEEKYLCTACNHGFYLPGGVCNEADDKQGKQRLEALKANPPNASGQAREE